MTERSTLLSERPVAGEHGTDERITCPDGYYWVRIVTREALRREGLAMVNCLASKAHDDFVGHERLSAPLIWSLRRVSDGRSIADVEVFYLEVLQVRGPANNLIGPQAAKQIEHLVARYARGGMQLEFHHACKVAVGADGRTWRRDKAPAELVAGLIGEARARLLAARALRRRMREDADLVMSLEDDHYDPGIIVWKGGRATIGVDTQVRQ